MSFFLGFLAISDPQNGPFWSVSPLISAKKPNFFSRASRAGGLIILSFQILNRSGGLIVRFFFIINRTVTNHLVKAAVAALGRELADYGLKLALEEARNTPLSDQNTLDITCS